MVVQLRRCGKESRNGLWGIFEFGYLEAMRSFLKTLDSGFRRNDVLKAGGKKLAQYLQMVLT